MSESTMASARPAEGGTATEDAGIRPFSFHASDEDLADLRRRIGPALAREETVDDHSQGVQLATMQALARYWAHRLRLAQCEARINAFPKFTTEIDGLDIHFIHVRSRTRTRCR